MPRPMRRSSIVMPAIASEWLAISRAAMSARLRIHGDDDLFLDQLPDLVDVFQKAGIALERKLAGPLEGDSDVGGEPSGPIGKNQHAIGEIDGLVDLMGNEHHRLFPLRT